MPPAARRAIEAEAGVHTYSLLRAAVENLMPAYRSEDFTRMPVIDDDLTAIAYAVYRLPGTYAASAAALAATAASLPGWSPSTMVDVGGGSGAGVWAAANALASSPSVEVLDRSRASRELGRRITSATGHGEGVSWLPFQVGDPIPIADLAFSAYLLDELAPEQRGALVAAMTASTTVVIVEPGTTAGYRRILEARTALIESGMSIVAPCPHDSECPLAAGDWCHFAARYGRLPLQRRLKGGDHGHDDEKYSYIAASRLPPEPVGTRVIRHPQKRKGMVTLTLCRDVGEASEEVVTRSRPEPYRRARDVRWGDSW